MTTASLPPLGSCRRRTFGLERGGARVGHLYVDVREARERHDPRRATGWLLDGSVMLVDWAAVIDDTLGLPLVADGLVPLTPELEQAFADGVWIVDDAVLSVRLLTDPAESAARAQAFGR